MDLLLPAPEGGLGTASAPVDVPQAQVDLHQFYGQNWLDRGGVRVNFIASVDGAATAAGLSRGLQTPGDHRVFATLRDLADVVLVGAATAAAESYQPIKLSERRQQLRQSLGLSAMPATAVVSSSLNLDLSAELFEKAHSASPTIVITGSHAPVSARDDIIDLAGSDSAVQLLEVPAAGDGVSFAGAVERLQELGYNRILCEGGPRLFTAGLAAGCVTELCLSISPLLIGIAGSRILSPDGWAEGSTPHLQLLGVLTEDSALFCRYAVLPADPAQ